MKLIIIALSGSLIMIGVASFHKSLILSIVLMVVGIAGVCYGVIRAHQDRSIL
jgi:Flp pilus assembly protein TadB